MHIDDIKRGLRAEIKKRENEQYATFQCNVRQMCKDVLAKLEEQESEIAELKDIDSKNRSAYYKDLAMMAKDVEHHKYKRCLAMADMNWWQANRYSAAEMVERIRWNLEEARQCSKLEEKYLKRYHKWLALAEKFKPNKSTAQYGKGKQNGRSNTSLRVHIGLPKKSRNF